MNILPNQRREVAGFLHNARLCIEAVCNGRYNLSADTRRAAESVADAISLTESALGRQPTEFANPKIPGLAEMGRAVDTWAQPKPEEKGGA